MSEQRYDPFSPEALKSWIKMRDHYMLSLRSDPPTVADKLIDYIEALEADSERLEELELALKEGDVAYVTASDMIEPGKWKHIEIEFDLDRNPVSRESLAEAIDEAMEEPEDLRFDGLDR